MAYICLHIFRHITQKSLDIRRYAFIVFPDIRIFCSAFFGHFATAPRILFYQLTPEFLFRVWFYISLHRFYINTVPDFTKIIYILKEIGINNKTYTFKEIIQILFPEGMIKGGSRLISTSSDFELQKTLLVSYSVFP